MTARQIASVVTAASSSACPLPRYAICPGGKCQHIDPARACFLQNTGTFIDRGSCCIDVIYQQNGFCIRFYIITVTI